MTDSENVKKKSSYIIFIGVFLLLVLLGFFALQQFKLSETKNELLENYSYDELNGLEFKIPLFDDVKVTLLGSEITFIDNGKEFKVMQYHDVIQGNDKVYLPTMLVSPEGKQNYFVTAFVKQENTFVQKQSALLSTRSFLNYNFTVFDDILRVQYDTDTKQCNLVHEDKFFNTQKGNFVPYYPAIENGAIGMDVITNRWKWKQTVYADGSTVLPTDDIEFQMSLSEEGKISSTTDCNQIQGKFLMTQTGSANFGDIGFESGDSCSANIELTALDKCKTSLALDYANMFYDVQTFYQTGSTLEFGLKTNSGSMIFEKIER